MPRLRWSLLLLAVPLLAVLAVACGDGDGDDDDATPGNGGQPPLSDTAYLQTLCTGLSEYQDALLASTTADEIADVIREFADSMRAVTPPGDVAEFHVAFVEYLEAAVEEPTSLVTTRPPLPDEDVRERLASKVRDVPECKYPTFLGEQR